MQTDVSGAAYSPPNETSPVPPSATGDGFPSTTRLRLGDAVRSPPGPVRPGRAGPAPPPPPTNPPRAAPAKRFPPAPRGRPPRVAAAPRVAAPVPGPPYD